MRKNEKSRHWAFGSVVLPADQGSSESRYFPGKALQFFGPTSIIYDQQQ